LGTELAIQGTKKEANRYEIVPLVGRLAGIRIYIHPFDHGPPHAHVRKAGIEIMIDLRTLDIMEGQMPPKAYAEVRTWMQQHYDEIIHRWDLAQNGEGFDPIEESEQ
jgi:hypothetical protein